MAIHHNVGTWYTRSHHSALLADGSKWEDHPRNSFCAAPSSIPMHSKIKIRNLENGKTLIVIVRDRGCNTIDLPSRGWSQITGIRNRRKMIQKGIFQLRWSMIKSGKKSRKH